MSIYIVLAPVMLGSGVFCRVKDGLHRGNFSKLEQLLRLALDHEITT